MKRTILALLTALGAYAGCATLSAQTVQILFTQSTLPKSLALKSALKGVTIESFPAFALMNVSAERKQAYIQKIAHLDAVLVLGDEAAKAAAQLEFPIPVVVMNAVGAVRSKGAVVRLFEADFPAAPAGARTIATPDAIASLEIAKAAAEVAIRCPGTLVPAALERVLAGLVRN
jgi:hypothetical protein